MAAKLMPSNADCFIFFFLGLYKNGCLLAPIIVFVSNLNTNFDDQLKLQDAYLASLAAEAAAGAAAEDGADLNHLV